MKKKFIILSISVIYSLTSCVGSSNDPATPIDAQQFEKLRENKENDGKRFSITGYPYLNRDVTVRNDMDISITLHSEPKGKGEYIGSIELGYKDSKNGMYIPDQFTPEDLQIFDNEGNQLTINDKIIISFTMELETNREPNDGGIKMEKDEKGIPRMIKTAPTYYGQGPVDIKIEKVQ